MGINDPVFGQTMASGSYKCVYNSVCVCVHVRACLYMSREHGGNVNGYLQSCQDGLPEGGGRWKMNWVVGAKLDEKKLCI